VTESLLKIPGLPPQAQVQIVKGVSNGIGGGAKPPADAPPALVAKVGTALSNAVADAAKPAVAFAGAVVTLGALLSLLVPNIPPEVERVVETEWGGLEPESETEPEPEPEPA
jgi:hypothetical protein